jgi:hypothetical protein
MYWLPRYLVQSLRTKPGVGRTQSQKPWLETLEARALLSASPATMPNGGAASAAISLHSTAIVACAMSSQGIIPHDLSLNSIHGGHAKAGTIHMTMRHVVAK